MKRVIVLLGICCLLVTVSVAAQETPYWEAVLFDTGSDQLVTLDASGVLERRDLPPQALGSSSEVEVRVTAISPNRRYASVVHDYSQAMFLVDFESTSCCLSVPLPAGVSHAEYVDATFSPDSRMMAVSYVSFTETDVVGGIMVIDVQTNEVRFNLDSSRYGIEWALAAMELRWGQNGIGFMPNCWGCEPGLEGQRVLWTPGDDQVIYSDEYISLIGDQLYNTGEWLIPEDHPAFPISPEPVGFMAPSNVIMYGNRTMSDPVVVFHDPANLDLPSPRWVIDGNAFFLLDWQTYIGTLYYRNGAMNQYGFDADTQFLTGTRDGWLMTDDTFQIYHYVENQDGQIGLNILDTFVGAPIVVYNVPMGNVNSGSFTPIPEPASTVCPGFIASRLRVNRSGQVLPGTPNNLRAEPSTNSARVGQIPGDGIFHVLEGPVCAENFAWWRVDYQGTVGWTVEGQGSEYWVQPLDQ